MTRSKPKGTKKIKFREYIDHAFKQIIRGIVAFLFFLLLYYSGLIWVFHQKGSPTPVLWATVNCESWRSPWCVNKRAKDLEEVNGLMKKLINQVEDLDLKNVVPLDEGSGAQNTTRNTVLNTDKDLYTQCANVLKNLHHDANDLLDYHLSESIVHPNNIKCVLCAEGMYTIKVENKGDREASNPIMAIEGNLYSEVIRGTGKGDKGAPEEHFVPKEIKLGPIQAGKTTAVEVTAWVSDQPNRRRAKKIEITCEGRPALLRVETPIRTFTRRFDKHFWKVVILAPVVVVLFHVLIKYRRKILSAIRK
jgi:hypothetical protein